MDEKNAELLKDIVEHICEIYHNTGKGLEPMNVLKIDDKSSMVRYEEMFEGIRQSIPYDVIPLVSSNTLLSSDNEIFTFYTGEVNVNIDHLHISGYYRFLYMRGYDKHEEIQIYLEDHNGMVISIMQKCNDNDGTVDSLTVECRRWSDGDYIMLTFIEASYNRQTNNPALF